MMTDTVTDAEIPELAIVFCPIKGKEHLMRGCSRRECNLGLIRQDGEQESFGEQYRLACAATIPRKITVIEE